METFLCYLFAWVFLVIGAYLWDSAITAGNFTTLQKWGSIIIKFVLGFFCIGISTILLLEFLFRMK